MSTRIEAFARIIAKGQGCYETLIELSSSVPVCYLLIAKCPVVAVDLGVPSQSGVVKFVDRTLSVDDLASCLAHED